MQPWIKTIQFGYRWQHLLYKADTLLKINLKQVGLIWFWRNEFMVFNLQRIVYNMCTSFASTLLIELDCDTLDKKAKRHGVDTMFNETLVEIWQSLIREAVLLLLWQG